MKESPRIVPRIHPPYAWRIVRTSLILWLLIRLALVLISGTLVLATGASLFLIVATVFLCWWDGRRLHEHLYHQNLGTPVYLGVAISVAAVAGAEMGTVALARTLTG